VFGSKDETKRKPRLSDARAKVNTLAMMMALDFAKSTSTQWKEFDHFLAVGFVRIEEFRKRNFRYIWRSSNSFTMPANAARRSFKHSSKRCSNHQPGTGDELN